MSIFNRRGKNNAAELERIIAMRERARSIREQIGRRDVQLPDLFAMLSEDERPAYWPAEANAETLQAGSQRFRN
jgi:hypothetical protein